MLLDAYGNGEDEAEANPKIRVLNVIKAYLVTLLPISDIIACSGVLSMADGIPVPLTSCPPVLLFDDYTQGWLYACAQTMEDGVTL